MKVYVITNKKNSIIGLGFSLLVVKEGVYLALRTKYFICVKKAQNVPGNLVLANFNNSELKSIQYLYPNMKMNDMDKTEGVLFTNELPNKFTTDQLRELIEKTKTNIKPEDRACDIYNDMRSKPYLPATHGNRHPFWADDMNLELEHGLFMDHNGKITEAEERTAVSVTFCPATTLMDIHIHPMGGYFSGIDDNIDSQCPGHITFLLSKKYTFEDKKFAIRLWKTKYTLMGRISLGKHGFIKIHRDLFPRCIQFKTDRELNNCKSSYKQELDNLYNLGKENLIDEELKYRAWWWDNNPNSDIDKYFDPEYMREAERIEKELQREYEQERAQRRKAGEFRKRQPAIPPEHMRGRLFGIEIPFLKTANGKGHNKSKK